MSLVSPRYMPTRTPEKTNLGDAITSRPSSTANFYIDSLDKPEGQKSGNFQITKNQNLFNGFFNRIGVSEIVLDWGLPNVAAYWGNSTLSVTCSGAVAGTQNIFIQDGFYTVEQVVDEIIIQLNTAFATAGLFVASPIASTYVLAVDQGVSVTSFVINSASFVSGGVTYTPGVLARLLFASASIDAAAAVLQAIQSPRLLGTTYVDIVSPQLTYNQDLKDGTTANLSRDVLYRWYIAYDNVPVILDAYSFPILQGYDPFLIRRTPPVPKQILWNPTAPIGNISFQVYDDKGRIIDTANFPSGANFQFQMSMLLSEN